MKVGIIQPSYLPWLGYFEQMARVDLFVYFDNVQYTKKDWRNRNRIKTSRGPHLVTIPIHRVALKTPINQIEINYARDWTLDHLNLLKENYRRAPFYEEIIEILRGHLSKKYHLLSEINFDLTNALAAYMGIGTKTCLASEFNIASSDKNQRIIDLCKRVGANVLYDGKSAEEFIDLDRFRAEGIEVVFQDYRHPEYQQFHPPFVSHLSVVDLLFHHGPESRDIILS